MKESPVKVVSVTDVACATTTAAAFAVLGLEIANDFLMNMKREGKNFIEDWGNEQENQWAYDFTQHAEHTHSNCS